MVPHVQSRRNGQRSLCCTPFRGEIKEEWTKYHKTQKIYLRIWIATSRLRTWKDSEFFFIHVFLWKGYFTNDHFQKGNSKFSFVGILSDRPVCLWSLQRTLLFLSGVRISFVFSNVYTYTTQNKIVSFIGALLCIKGGKAIETSKWMIYCDFLNGKKTVVIRLILPRSIRIH